MRRTFVAAFALVAGACRLADPPVGSSEGSLIQDAVHNGGRPGFYFLPPLVPATPLPPVFDDSLSLTGRLDGGSVSASFPLRVDPGAQNYVGDLDTAPLSLDAATLYRVHVLSGEIELGFADVRVYEGHAHNVATNDEFELVEGKKLRVKVYVNRCAAVVCEATACRKAGTCEPQTGACSLGPPFVDGSSCSDGNRCNGDERCFSGDCKSGTPVVCEDHDVCTTNRCQPESGSCEFTPVAGCCTDAGDCDDGNACTVDACPEVGGACSHTTAADARWDCATWDQATWGP